MPFGFGFLNDTPSASLDVLKMKDRRVHFRNSGVKRLRVNLFIPGNVFSSLRGLEFQWSLHSDTSDEEEAVVDADSILR